MTHLNKLQTLNIVCPNCGQKHLKTVAWLAEYQHIDCICGNKTSASAIESLVNQAVEELK